MLAFGHEVVERGPLASLDVRIAGAMARHGITLARLSLAIVFIWFGALKPFGASPANQLVADTVAAMGVDPSWFIPFLGWWEVAIGLCFLSTNPVVTRLGIGLLFMQMPGTFLPVILLPDQVFLTFPFELTMEGQYIVKNFVLISAALVVGGAVRNRAVAAARRTA